MATNESTPTPVKQESDNKLVGTLVIVVIVTALIALIGFLFLKPKSDLLEGQAEATSIRISGKLPGRVQEIYVQEGQQVKAGDKLIAFDRDKIAAAHHPDIVMVLVTNSDDYENLTIQTGSYQVLDKVIQV